MEASSAQTGLTAVELLLIESENVFQVKAQENSQTLNLLAQFPVSNQMSTL